VNDELLRFHGFVRPPFEKVADGRELLQPYSVSALIDDISVELYGGNFIVGVRGVRGIGKTCFAKLLAATLQARDFCTLQAEGAAAQPQHVQRRFGEAAGLTEARPDPARLLAMLQQEYSQKRLVLIIDDAEALSAAMFKYLWQMLELCRLQSIRLHLVLVGDIGVWPGLNAPGLAAMRRAAISRHMIPCLNEDEAADYLEHKLGFAGRALSDLITPNALAGLIAQSNGIPQRLNELTETALRQACDDHAPLVTARRLRGALGIAPPDVFERFRSLVPMPALAAAGSVIMLAGGLGLLSLLNAATVPPAAPRIADALPATPRVLAATLLQPEAPPAGPDFSTLAEVPPRTESAAPAQDGSQTAKPPSGRGLVLIATAGDNIANMYARVYRGLEPPPFTDVLAANADPIRPGSLVVFPEPPKGWEPK
jgi:type II secretory pathway predicted ATPase ExeA